MLVDNVIILSLASARKNYEQKHETEMNSSSH